MVTRTDTESPVTPLKEKGFINIGSHPSNDVVIAGDDVQPFHALLDCREQPYTLVPLSPDVEIRLNDMDLPARGVYQLRDTDTLGLGNHRLRILPASNGSPLRVAVASGQTEAEESPVPGEMVAAGLPGAAQDDVILASLDKESAEISVDQTAVFVLTLGNGSPIVSTFHVQVDGIPDEWVLVSPANVNLNEGARGMVTVQITPPRRPTSTAGEHDVRFNITSHNHPDRRVTLHAALTIAPFYDYAISDLSPQRRRIGWGQKTGQVTMEVTNRGNSSAPFLLTAQDEENGCTFQFIDANGLKQPAQVQYSIPPGETFPVPLHIAPVKRSFIRMRAQSFPYRVVTTQPQNPIMTLFTTGTAICRPLINALGLFLILALLVGVTGYLFTPRVNYFTADSNLIGVGESTTLRWKTSPFTHNVQIAGVEKPVSGSQGATQVFPATTVNTYTLTASTWLWSLLGLTPRTLPVTVLAVPGEPIISTFTISAEKALVGDEVSLRWSADHTDKMQLTINGVTETFEDPKDFNGERKLPIEKPTLISLVAQNTSGSVVRSKFIEVNQPSIVIEKFELSESTITTGDQVTIGWKVSGIGMEDGGEVTISAFDSVLPLEGQMTFFPTESMEFVLTARNRKLQESRILPVGVLPPGTPPQPPTIDFFTAAPETLVGPGSVELAWSVSGAFDKITISNGSTIVADNLAAQGFRTIQVSTSGTYVITATNAGESAGANLQITVDPALIKPKLSITSVFPEEDLEMGDAALVSISIANPKAGDPPPTGKVIVTDGTSSCVIELPKVNCSLEFETPGDKTITANYQGDSLHVQTVSDPYPKTIVVLGNTISLRVNPIPDSLVYRFNQVITLHVIVDGTNPSRVPDGELRVRRICDPTAIYARTCTDDVIGYHKLASSDSGSYKFEGLTIDQVGGAWNLLITFSGDSFYSNAEQSALLPIDNTTSPVSITAVTTDPLPGLTGSLLNYTITVRDENAAGVYYVPGGTVTMVATHSDGVTTVECLDLTLAAAGDGRSSVATCGLRPTKSGAWTLRVDYKKSDVDIIHNDSTQTYPAIAVNSNTQATITSAPGTAAYSTSNTIQLSLVRGEDTSVAVTNGTMGCSFGGGSSDGTCSCSYNSGSNWRCTFNPRPVDILPATKTITIDYTPATGTYLNSVRLTHTLTVERAPTTAGLTATPSATYPVDGTYTFRITAVHAGGGTAPAKGTVTAFLGTGTCTTNDGMTTGVLDTSTVNLNTEQTFTFATRHQVGNLSVCYRYDGDEQSYAASPYLQTSAFTVVAAGTTATIASQPASTYEVGGTFAITVNAEKSNGTAITQGNVTIQLGTGTCNASTGMSSSTILNTYTNTVGAATTVTFLSSHVGKDLRFCVRYDGHSTSLSASPWVGSNVFRVKAVPTWSAGSAVDFTASGAKNKYTEFTVTLNNAYQPMGSHVQLVLTSDNNTIVCPSASSAQPDCQYVSRSTSGTAATFTFKVAASTASTWSVQPRYVDELTSTDIDQNNKPVTGAAFNLRSYYNISVASVSTSQGCPSCTGGTLLLWAYSPYEISTSDKMQTDITATITVADFDNFDYTAAGLSASVAAIDNGGASSPVDPDSGACSIANATASGKQVGRITCPAVKVRNSMVNRFRITVTPSDPSLFGTNLTANSASGHRVVGNIIEEPSDSLYGIKVTNLGCTGKRQDFQVEGYAAGTGDTATPLLPSDFIFNLTCEDNNDGNDNWDDTYAYGSNNSTFSPNLVWDTSVSPPKFTFSFYASSSSTDGYSGCESDADGVRFTLGLIDWGNPAATSVKDFEILVWSTGDTYLRDDKGGGSLKYDDCRNN